MSDLIYRQVAIAELNEIAKMKHAILDSLNISDRRARDMIEAELGQINDDIDSIKDMPSAQTEDWMERNKERILQAGMEGREVEFYIGGRLFAIREIAQ